MIRIGVVFNSTERKDYLIIIENIFSRKDVPLIYGEAF